MPRGTPLYLYIAAARAENAAQFLGRYTNGENSFFVAATDVEMLRGISNIVDVEPLGDSPDCRATIVTRHNGHKELFVDPAVRNYRDIHLAFLKQIGVANHAAQLSGYDSDHVYPKSAALGQGVQVAMHLVESSANRSWGSGWEKRLTHDRLGVDSPLKKGELAAFLKAASIMMADATDPVHTLQVGVESLINRGDVSASDRRLMLARADECMSEKQTQDENYAADQVDLRPGMPLKPGAGSSRRPTA